MGEAVPQWHDLKETAGITAMSTDVRKQSRQEARRLASFCEQTLHIPYPIPACSYLFYPQHISPSAEVYTSPLINAKRREIKAD